MYLRKFVEGDTQVMTLFSEFQFCGINNSSIPPIVAVLSACSRDFSPSFLKLFESSPPGVSRPDLDPGPQCELHALAVLEVPSAAKVFQASKCMEIARRDVQRIGWMR